MVGKIVEVASYRLMSRIIGILQTDHVSYIIRADPRRESFE